MATVDVSTDGAWVAWAAAGRIHLAPAGRAASGRDVGPGDIVRFSPDGQLLLVSSAQAGTILDLSGAVVGPASVSRLLARRRTGVPAMTRLHRSFLVSVISVAAVLLTGGPVAAADDFTLPFLNPGITLGYGMDRDLRVGLPARLDRPAVGRHGRPRRAGVRPAHRAGLRHAAPDGRGRGPQRNRRVAGGGIRDQPARGLRQLRARAPRGRARHPLLPPGPAGGSGHGGPIGGRGAGHRQVRMQRHLHRAAPALRAPATGERRLAVGGSHVRAFVDHVARTGRVSWPPTWARATGRPRSSSA